MLDDRGIDRALLAGASMGAHTIVRFALDHGDRVAGLVVVTPAFDPDDTQDETARLARWDKLSDGLRRGGVEGFVAGLRDPEVARALARDDLQGAAPAARRARAPGGGRRRAARRPALAPFEAWSELSELEVPAVVVASRDEADPEHPYAVGERYAEAIPGAELRSEEPGASPMAWQGSQLSAVIAELGARA